MPPNVREDDAMIKWIQHPLTVLLGRAASAIMVVLAMLIWNDVRTLSSQMLEIRITLAAYEQRLSFAERQIDRQNGLRPTEAPGRTGGR